MKIAVKFAVLAICSAGVLVSAETRAQMLNETTAAVGSAGMVGAGAVRAGAGMAAPSSPDIAAPSVAAAPVAPTVTASAPVAEPGVELPVSPNGSSDSGAQIDMMDSESESDTPGFASGEKSKVPDAVKNVMKRLNSSTSNITLEDLNAAREAVARLDMMIELEKKLKDLSEVRKDRDEVGGLASSIPSSALSNRFPSPQQPVPPSIPMTPVAAPAYIPPPTSFVPPSTDVSVERIFGAAGRYVATLKVDDGTPQIVRVGDKLTDGSEVVGISEKGVTLLHDKKRRTISVRNVNTIFSSR